MCLKLKGIAQTNKKKKTEEAPFRGIKRLMLLIVHGNFAAACRGRRGCCADYNCVGFGRASGSSRSGGRLPWHYARQDWSAPFPSGARRSSLNVACLARPSAFEVWSRLAG